MNTCLAIILWKKTIWKQLGKVGFVYTCSSYQSMFNLGFRNHSIESRLKHYINWEQTWVFWTAHTCGINVWLKVVRYISYYFERRAFEKRHILGNISTVICFRRNITGMRKLTNYFSSLPELNLLLLKENSHHQFCINKSENIYIFFFLRFDKNQTSNIVCC